MVTDTRSQARVSTTLARRLPLAVVSRPQTKGGEEYTGRSSDAWIKEGSRFIKTRPWTAVAMVAVAAYVFGKLRG